MQVTISNRIKITEPTPEIQHYCRTKLNIDNPEFYTKQKMGFYVGRTPRTLDLYTRDGLNWYLPFGSWSNVRKLIPEGTHIDVDVASHKKVSYQQENEEIPAIELWDYQEAAIKAALNNNCGIIQAPCGCGKTIMGLNIVKRAGKKALWLTHTKDLLTQSKESAISLGFPKDMIGTITDGKVNISEGITFATVQTLSKLETLYKYKYTWDIVIVDECHRAAGTPNRYTQFSTVLNTLAAPRKYGLSATVDRADGLIETVFALLGEKIYEVSAESVKNMTVPVTVQQVNTGIGISPAALDTDGTLVFSKLLSYLADNPDRNKVIAKNLYENRNESNLVLSDRLDNLRGLIDCLKALGIPADRIRMIDGSQTTKTGRKARQQAIIDMREGKADYLFATYNLAKEGLNIPRLNRLHLATPHKFPAIIQQCVGRIARKAPDKGEAICYDYIDAMGYTVNAGKARNRVYNKEGCTVHSVKIQAINNTQSSFMSFAQI